MARDDRGARVNRHAGRGDLWSPAQWRPGLRRPHFLSKESGGKERAGRGISIFPALHPPLETTNQGACGPRVKEYLISFWLKHATGMFLNAKTYWMYPPELFYRQLTGGEGFLRNASAAGGQHCRARHP